MITSWNQDWFSLLVPGLRLPCGILVTVGGSARSKMVSVGKLQERLKAEFLQLVVRIWVMSSVWNRVRLLCWKVVHDF
jgi:hypothetical protein